MMKFARTAALLIASTTAITGCGPSPRQTVPSHTSEAPATSVAPVTATPVTAMPTAEPLVPAATASANPIPLPNAQAVPAPKPTSSPEPPPGFEIPEAVPVARAEATVEERRALLERLYRSPKHRPPELDGPVSPSRVKSGKYRCRTSKEYKLRDCVVTRDENGRTFLEFVGPQHLIAMKGLLFDDGANTKFVGWLTDKRPFGCYGCQERCFLRPGSCGCIPRDPQAIPPCVSQRLEMVLRGRNTLAGKLRYDNYFNRYVTHDDGVRRVEGYTIDKQSFEVLITR